MNEEIFGKKFVSYRIKKGKIFHRKHWISFLWITRKYMVIIIYILLPGVSGGGEDTATGSPISISRGGEFSRVTQDIRPADIWKDHNKPKITLMITFLLRI